MSAVSVPAQRNNINIRSRSLAENGEAAKNLTTNARIIPINQPRHGTKG